eukprot:3409026-Prymnesium_polylepis.1
MAGAPPNMWQARTERVQSFCSASSNKSGSSGKPSVISTTTTWAREGDRTWQVRSNVHAHNAHALAHAHAHAHDTCTCNMHVHTT